MASAALAKMRESRNRMRLRSAMELAKREHSIYAVAGALALGISEAKGHTLPTLGGLNGEFWIGGLAFFLADPIGGGLGRVVQSLADGALCIGAYKMGRHFGGKAIAGLGEAEAIEAVLAS